MRHAPTLAENGHPTRAQVSVQRRLREDEIDIRPLAVLDQLRRQNMEALIPGESSGLGINDQANREQREGGNEEKGRPVVADGFHTR